MGVDEATVVRMVGQILAGPPLDHQSSLTVETISSGPSSSSSSSTSPSGRICCIFPEDIRPDADSHRSRMLNGALTFIREPGTKHNLEIAARKSPEQAGVFQLFKLRYDIVSSDAAATQVGASTSGGEELKCSRCEAVKSRLRVGDGFLKFGYEEDESSISSNLVDPSTKNEGCSVFAVVDTANERVTHVSPRIVSFESAEQASRFLTNPAILSIKQWTSSATPASASATSSSTATTTRAAAGGQPPVTTIITPASPTASVPPASTSSSSGSGQSDASSSKSASAYPVPPKEVAPRISVSAKSASMSALPTEDDRVAAITSGLQRLSASTEDLSKTAQHDRIPANIDLSLSLESSNDGPASLSNSKADLKLSNLMGKQKGETIRTTETGTLLASTGGDSQFSSAVSSTDGGRFSRSTVRILRRAPPDLVSDSDEDSEEEETEDETTSNEEAEEEIEEEEEEDEEAIQAEIVADQEETELMWEWMSCFQPYALSEADQIDLIVRAKRIKRLLASPVFSRGTTTDFLLSALVLKTDEKLKYQWPHELDVQRVINILWFLENYNQSPSTRTAFQHLRSLIAPVHMQNAMARAERILCLSLKKDLGLANEDQEWLAYAVLNAATWIEAGKPAQDAFITKRFGPMGLRGLTTRVLQAAFETVELKDIKVILSAQEDEEQVNSAVERSSLRHEAAISVRITPPPSKNVSAALKIDEIPVEESGLKIERSDIPLEDKGKQPVSTPELPSDDPRFFSAPSTDS